MTAIPPDHMKMPAFGDVHFLISAAETACGLIHSDPVNLAYDPRMVSCPACKNTDACKAAAS